MHSAHLTYSNYRNVTTDGQTDREKDRQTDLSWLLQRSHIASNAAALLKNGGKTKRVWVDRQRINLSRVMCIVQWPVLSTPPADRWTMDLPRRRALHDSLV